MASYDEYKALVKKGNYKEAAFMAQRAAAANGKDSVFWLNQQAQALLKGNKPKEAQEIACQVLLVDKTQCFAMLICADALLLMGKSADALVHFRAAANFPAAMERARQGSVDCLIKLRKFTDALDEIALCKERAPSLFTAKVKALAGLDRNDEAIEMCNEWLREVPDDRTVLRMLFELEIKMFGEAQALIKYEACAAAASRTSIYTEFRNELQERLEVQNGALGGGNGSSAKQPSAFSISKRAFALAKSGKEREAIPLMEALLRKDPCNQFVNNGYIAAARRAAYLVPAWKFYQELSGLFPEEKTIHANLRRIAKECIQSGRPV